MSRLPVFTPTDADRSLSIITDSAINRLSVFGNATCPLETARAFFDLCASQSCGKCTPCRIGLTRLSEDLELILRGEEVEGIVDNLVQTCETLYKTADCAIGFEAGRIGLAFADLIREDAESHIKNNRCIQTFTAVPCAKGCPTHVDIPGYIALVRNGRYADAVRLIRNDNPFPSACAFVCEHPCEDNCRRGMIDAPVNIRAIKMRAVTEAGKVDPPAKQPATGKKVAIIGGGPSGLTAAYYLALMGHSVTIYEQFNRLGGMLLYGIPRYRLPQEWLDYDIDNILSLGIEVKYNTAVSYDVPWEEIESEYDAFYISIGAHTYSDLGIPYETHENVQPAVEFLHKASSGNHVDLTGKDVIIVGGGNVAMDATRTAKRLGAKRVRCVYRRRRVDMTALPDEVDAAIAEGCEILDLLAPVKVAKGTDKPLALICQPQMPSFYKGGRPAPKPTEEEPRSLECDLLIEAIGQRIDSSSFEKAGIKTNRGRFVGDEFGHIAEDSNIFVGGDSQSGPATVIRAIAAGKAAAANIDEYLGFNHDVYDEVEIPAPQFDSKLACGRVNLSERYPNDRQNDFEGTERPMRPEEAEQECARCLRCDHYGMGSLRGGRPRKW